MNASSSKLPIAPGLTRSDTALNQVWGLEMVEEVQILECDIPLGMTCAEYRQMLAESKKPSLLQKLARLVKV